MCELERDQLPYPISQFLGGQFVTDTGTYSLGNKELKGQYREIFM